MLWKRKDTLNERIITNQRIIIESQKEEIDELREYKKRAECVHKKLRDKIMAWDKEESKAKRDKTEGQLHGTTDKGAIVCHPV